MARLYSSQVVLLHALCLVQNAMFLVPETTNTSMELWTASCPYNDFCTIEAKLEFKDTDKQSCCSKCSCDEDCWVLNNCCPDVIHDRPTDLEAATCTTLGLENSYAINGDLDTYHVFDFCPRDYDDNNNLVVDRCEERFSDVNVTDLTDIVAVSDSKNRIYKNKYCAMCHGVHDVDMWKLRLVACRENMDFSKLTASQYTQELLENCKIESFPPTNKLRTRSVMMKCGDSLSHRCSSVADTDAHAVHIVNSCLNGPDIPFVQKAVTYHLLYKNVFCYLCKKKPIHQTMCSLTKDIPSKSTFNKFGVIMDTCLDTRRRAKMASRQMMSLRCNEGQVFDGVKERCITLHCMPYSVKLFGECLNLSTSFINYAIAVIVKYEPVLEHVMADIREYDEQEAKQFITQALRKYGMETCTVNVFQLCTYVEKTSNTLRHVELKLQLQVDDTCQPVVIAKAVRMHLSTYENTSIAINDLDIPLTGGKIKFFSKPNDQISVANPYVYKQRSLIIEHGPAQFSTVSSGFFLCPYFVIDIREYNSVISDVFGNGNEANLTEISETTRVKDGFYTLTNSTIAVCMDTYFELYKSSGNSLTMKGPQMCFVGVLATCLVGIVASLLY